METLPEITELLKKDEQNPETEGKGRSFRLPGADSWAPKFDNHPDSTR